MELSKEFSFLKWEILENRIFQTQHECICLWRAVLLLIAMFFIRIHETGFIIWDLMYYFYFLYYTTVYVYYYRSRSSFWNDEIFLYYYFIFYRHDSLNLSQVVLLWSLFNCSTISINIFMFFKNLAILFGVFSFFE